MVKTYILDTNVLLTEPRSIYSFQDNEVVLPFTIIEELDKIKSRPNQVGANAREMARVLTDLIEEHPETNLRDGIMLEHGGKLRVLSISDFDENVRLPNELDPSNKDNHILGVCYAMLLQAKSLGKEAPILVTKDILLRVKCNTIGIPCEDYKGLDVAETVDSIYRGYTVLDVDDDVLQSYYESINDTLLAADLNPIFEEKGIPKPAPNEFIILRNPDHPSYENSPFVRWVGDGYLAKMPAPISEKNGIYGLRPRNLEQRMALDLLMDSNVDMVTLIGSAGTGKSLLAIAAGLQQVIEKKQYKRLVVIKPTVAVGSEQGFLPGPQPLDAKILTPNGWSTMGDLKVGDYVFARDGKPTRVLGVYPKGKKDVYKVTTTDGRSTECCEDHLWYTHTYEDIKRKRKGSVKSTKEIMGTFHKELGWAGRTRPNHYLPINESIEYNKKELPIAPYTVGALLGDGSIGGSMVLVNKDPEIIDRVTVELQQLGMDVVHDGNLGYRAKNRNHYNNKPARCVRLTNLVTGEIQTWPTIGLAAKEIMHIKRNTLGSRCRRQLVIDNIQYEFVPDSGPRWSNKLKNTFEQLGLVGKHAENKFIPRIYMESDIEDRLALLRGLMDTDGTCKKNGESMFCTASPQLAADIRELVWSLGGKTTICTRDRRGKKQPNVDISKTKSFQHNYVTHEFTISLPKDKNPFFVSRKAKRYNQKYVHNIGIASIEKVGVKEVQCIRIDNPEHLYITDDYIVTHNTKDEKLLPWLAPIMDNLRQLMFSGKKSKYNESMITDLMEDGTIELEAITYLRGRSISDAYIIIDESQNCGSHELKTILTRVGENSKIVLTGDIEQIDNVYLDAVSNGLAIAVEKFKESDITGHCTMVKGERSKLATLAAKVL